MTRRFWINIHLYLAAFFAPILLLIALSGGMYLFGYKGSVATTPVTLPTDASLNFNSSRLEADLRQLLRSVDAEFDFEYVKRSGNTLITRPTSRPYYQVIRAQGELEVTHNQPDLQKRMVELHKGHGPGLFKTLQKFTAAALILIVLSGFWLGVSSDGLIRNTLLTSAGGLLVMLALIYFG